MDFKGCAVIILIYDINGFVCPKRRIAPLSCLDTVPSGLKKGKAWWQLQAEV